MASHIIETEVPFESGKCLEIEQLDQNFSAGVTVSLRVTNVPQNVYGFHVDGNRNIMRKSRCRKGFSTKIPVKKTNPPSRSERESGILHTEQTENNIRFLELSGPGLMKVWEISLIFRNERPFLACQRVYKFAVYRRKGRCGDRELVSKRFGKNGSRPWPDLMSFCKEALQGSGKWEFVPIHPKEVDGKIPEPSPNGFTAVVDWFNVRIGLGSLKVTPNTEARVHFSDVETSRPASYLRAGERVRYDRLEKPTEDGRNTAFNWQAHHVVLPDE